MGANKLRWRDVRDTVRLDDVEDALGLEVETRGDEDWCSCPLPSHSGEDANPSFSINRSTYEHHCFSCGGGGGLPDLVIEVLSLDRQAALTWLCQYADLDSEESDTERWVGRLKRYMAPVEPEPFQSISHLHRHMPRVSQTQIANYEANLAGALDFIWHRWGIEPEVAADFRLGYSASYVHRRDLQGAAIIIPHFFHEQPVGWQARWTDDEMKPKYVNTPDFPKGITLYNWDRVRHGTDPLIVVESFATVMKLHQCGYPAVATFGASVAKLQVDILGTYRGEIYLAFDNDRAGQEGQDRLLEELKGHGRPLYVVPRPRKHKADLGDLSEAEITRLIDDAIPYYLADPGW